MAAAVRAAAQRVEVGGMWFWRVLNIGLHAVLKGEATFLSRPAGRGVRAFRVAVQDDYGLCIVVGARRVGLWLRCVCAGQERSPKTCIVAAFAAHQ